jgi:LysM domain
MRSRLHHLSLLAWLAVLGLVIAALSGLRRRFPSPPFDDVGALPRWWSMQDPLDAVAGIARLLCLVLVSYLLVVTLLQFVAGRRGWDRCANAAGRAAPRFVAIFVATLVATTTSAGAVRATSTVGSGPDVPGAGARMELIEDVDTARPARQARPTDTTPTTSASTTTTRPQTSLPRAATTTPPSTTTTTAVARPTTSTIAPAVSTSTTVSPRPTATPPTKPPTSSDSIAPGALIGPTASQPSPAGASPPSAASSSSADTAVTVAAADPPPAVRSDYLVQPGDHLWSIAERTVTERSGAEPSDREIGAYWRELLRLNEHRLVESGNPDLILPGQVLELPG